MRRFFEGRTLQAGINSFRVFNLKPEHLADKYVMDNLHEARPKKYTCLNVGDWVFLSSTSPTPCPEEYKAHCGFIGAVARIEMIETHHPKHWSTHYFFKHVYRFEKSKAKYTGTNTILDNGYAVSGSNPAFEAEVLEHLRAYALATYEGAEFGWTRAVPQS